MKVKMKFDLAAIKKGIFAHGEKVAFGLAVIVFLMFSWSALRLEVLDSNKQPDRLRQQATDTKTHVTKSAWDEKQQNLAVIDYNARSVRTPVPSDGYQLPQVWDPPLADRKSLRGTPEIFPAEELRITAGYDMFSLKDAPAAGAQPAPPGGASGGKPTGHPWVVVTGLVPIEKQKLAYHKNFEHTVTADKNKGPDEPVYVGVRLQRADDVEGKKPEELAWKTVAKSADFRALWGSTGNEIADSRYVNKGTTSPLGPIVKATWGASVMHPKIPYADAKQAPAQPAAAPPPPAEAPAAAAGGTEDFEAVKPDAPAHQAAAPVAAQAQAGIEHYLLRAFDYSAEPNKRYRYRVQLILANPNFNVAAQFLQVPEPPPSQYLETAWSPATPAVTVPDGYRVLVGPAIQRNSGEVLGRVILSSINNQNNVEASVDLEVQRGSVANQYEASAYADKKPLDAKVDFKTGIVALDIHGGKPLPLSKQRTKPTVPAEILLMDRDGNLSVRYELDDQKMYEERKPEEEKPVEKEPAPAPVKKKKAKLK